MVCRTRAGYYSGDGALSALVRSGETGRLLSGETGRLLSGETGRLLSGETDRLLSGETGGGMPAGSQRRSR